MNGSNEQTSLDNAIIVNNESIKSVLHVRMHPETEINKKKEQKESYTKLPINRSLLKAEGIQIRSLKLNLFGEIQSTTRYTIQ